MKITLIILILALQPILSGSAAEKAPTPVLELVMAQGDKVSATTKAGSIDIIAEAGLHRSYFWDGATRSVELWPRAERWYGSLGAYYPGPGEHWKSNNGITRGVLQEGKQNFDNMEAALKWLKQQIKWYATVYSNSGLVVSFDKVPERKQINVEVWQITINGKPPTKLEGASDMSVSLVPAKKK